MSELVLIAQVIGLNIETLIKVIGLVAIVMIAAKACGVTIPDWAWKILGVIVIVVVAIWAVRFIGGV